MKQTKIMQEIQDQMAPGVITAHGLLGDDRRNLVDILEEDDAQVKRMGQTHCAIAGRMKELLDCGRKGLGEFIKFDNNIEVSVETVRGKLPCPFGCAGLIQKRNITVKNNKLGKEITFTGLNIHMIEKHGFYEGKGSVFRLEPAELINILEIK